MITLLIIDDDDAFRTTIANELEDEGYSVYQAADGREGIKHAQTHLPDVILCDIKMPEMDGFEVLGELQKDPTTAPISFIFLTAHSDQPTTRHGMALGADDYLAKPVSIEEVLAAIQSRIEKRRVLTQQAERKLDELRTSMSLSLPHEIRTPLSGIMGFAELLRDLPDKLTPKEINEMAVMILKSAKRLGNLMENFLAYSQLEILLADPKRVSGIPKDSTAMLDINIEELGRKRAAEYNRTADLKFCLTKGEAVIPTVNMRKITEELIDNAFKFSQSGTQVTISSTIKGKWYILNVEDAGCGMSQEQISHIGAYFQFARKKREHQGAGLGLVIAKKMAELYGGSFELRSEPNRGTTVTVKLPAIVIPSSAGH
ncbi:MAG: response regulator [bacterium]